jgi:hypothetical protein
MLLDIGGARDELRINGSDASCDQLGVRQIANPDRTIETLCDQIDEAIAVESMDVKLRVAPCHFREHVGEVSRAESQWHGDSQVAAKVTSGQDRISGQVDLSTGPGRVVTECDPSFRQSGAAGISRKQLNAKFRFELGKPSTDDRLGNAEPACSVRNSPGIGNFYECPQPVDIQLERS